MFRLILLFTAGLLAITTFAQKKKFEFKLGTEYKLPRKTEDLAFYGNDKDGIINLSLKKEELSILRFDAKTLNQTSDKVIDLDVTRNFNSELVADLGTNCFWLHSDWDAASKTEMLYYNKVDVQTGKITVANKKLIETTKISGVYTVKGFSNLTVTGKYSFNYNASKKLLLVSYRLVPENKDDKVNYDKIGLYVFDENMNKLWGGEYKMPYTEAIMDNEGFSIDGQGNAYILAKVYDSEARKQLDKATGLPGYHYQVLKFAKGEKKIGITPLKLSTNLINQAVLIENAVHEMIVACTYRKVAGNAGTDGVFLATIDQAGKLVPYKTGYFEFPLAELAKFESAKKKRKMEKKDDYHATNLRINDVLVGNDGELLITYEEHYVISRTYTTNGTTTTRTTYYYEDIIACKISASGTMEWMRKIPKSQKGARGPGTMSFKLIADASGYYFLYLDNKKNLEMQEDDVPKEHIDGSGGQVVVAKIDGKGNITKDIVFDTRDEDIMLFPTEFRRINRNQFIGRAQVKKNLYQPLMITVN